MPGSRSISSGGDAEDEQSSSFQFANHKPRDSAAGAGGNGADVKGQPGRALCTWNMKGSRYPGRICLEALQVLTNLINKYQNHRNSYIYMNASLQIVKAGFKIFF